jgi:BirA family transcriptional regulator, biotin operon repressor / biotin---[acetyl-CoA-carboxylase] ligase
MSGDLDQASVVAALGERAVRAYPALLSTEPTAMAWARQGAPSGAVVVADYQASPRGRAGLVWHVQLGRGLGFTLLHRPADLPAAREGWPYVPALLALHDVVGAEADVLEWPDTVCSPQGPVRARLGVYVELGPQRTEWVSMTVLVEEAEPPRAPLLARLLEAMSDRLEQPPERVLADYRPRCSTLGRSVRARMLPLGPDGPAVTGEAVDVLADGALVLLTERGNRVAVPPHNLGLLEPPPGPVEPPEQIFGRFVS